MKMLGSKQEGQNAQTPTQAGAGSANENSFKNMDDDIAF